MFNVYGFLNVRIFFSCLDLQTNIVSLTSAKESSADNSLKSETMSDDRLDLSNQLMTEWLAKIEIGRDECTSVLFGDSDRVTADDADTRMFEFLHSGECR